MSKPQNPLERVIGEQQKEIDWLKDRIRRDSETNENMFKKHQDIFEKIARLVDISIPDRSNKDIFDWYCSIRNDARLALLDAGFCLGCSSFVCECDYDE